MMLPLLADFQKRRMPNHKYVEDTAGDGALIGLARDDEGTIVGVEILAAMVIRGEDGEPLEADEEPGPTYALVNLYLDPETARQMAMFLTMQSIYAEDEQAKGGTS